MKQLLVTICVAAVILGQAGDATGQHDALADPADDPAGTREGEPSESESEHHGGSGSFGDGSSESGSSEHHGNSEHTGEVNVSDSVAFTIAVMLILFVFVNMSLLYLVNYDDAHVREMSYHMISTMISIFCAVLFNQALFSFIYKQILPADPTLRMQYPWGGDTPIPRGFGLQVKPIHRVIGGVLLCSLSLVLLNSLCRRFRESGPGFVSVRMLKVKVEQLCCCGCMEDEDGYPMVETQAHTWLFAIQNIVSHVAAFAAINIFEHTGHWVRERPAGWRQTLQVPEDLSESVAMIGVFVVGVIFWIACLAIAKTVRNADEEVKWVETVMEGEEDAMSLSISWVVMEGLCHVPFFEHRVWMISIAFLLLLFVLTWARIHFSHTGASLRALRIGQTTMAMTCSWCLLRSGQHLFSGHGVLHAWIHNEHMAKVANAVGITFVSVPSAIVLTTVMKWLQSRMQQQLAPNATGGPTRHKTAALHSSNKEYQALDNNNAAPEVSNTNWAMATVIALPANEPGPPRHGSQKLAVPGQTNFDELVLPPHVIKNLSEFTGAIRKIVESCGILVGLAWDSAFEAAEESIIEGTHWTHAHQVVSKGLLAAVLILFVGKVWKSYIVPKAMMEVEEHESVLEAQRHQNLAGGYRMNDLIMLNQDADLDSSNSVLKSGDLGVVRGAPGKGRFWKVKCDFEQLKNVSVPVKWISRRGFPDTTGPFELIGAGIWRREGDVSFAGQDVRTLELNGKDGIPLKMEFDRLRKRVQSHMQGDKVEGLCSPISEITLPKEEFYEVNLPDDAKFFMWSYPVVSCKFDRDIDAASAPDLAFLRNGGFVYLDENKQIVGAKALVPSTFGSLRFVRRDWDDQVLVRPDEVRNRFRDITIPVLRDAGGKSFCWLTPKELGPHGGFGYEMHESAVKTSEGNKPAVPRYICMAVAGGDV